MKQIDVCEILKESNLKITPLRKLILDQFTILDTAISQKDLRSNLSEADRISIYRNIKTFIEKGILHEIVDVNGELKYAITQKDETDHDHIHFKCRMCDRTICIESAENPKIHLPKGFTNEKTHILLEGLCQQCSN